MNEQIEIKPNLIEKAADSEFAERAKTLTMHMSQNWLRYCALLVTGTLTGIAGWNLTNNILMTAFLILLCEGASLFWTARTEDNGNGTQTWLSVAGTVIAWVSIAITDLASATIIANHADVKVFSMFREVPSWAQAVVTYVLPTLAFTHGVLGTAHYYFSEDAKLKRDLAKTEREARRAVAKAEAEARKNIAQAKANKFKELADLKAAGIGETQGVALWDRYERKKGNVQTNEISDEDQVVEQLIEQDNPDNSHLAEVAKKNGNPTKGKK